MTNPPPVLDYKRLPPAPEYSIARRVILNLAVLSVLPMLLTGLAALDGLIFPNGDFVFEGWAKLFVLSCTFPALSLALRWRARRRSP